MYIVTGGAGFIGSNLVKGLNEQGIDDILIVDNLTNGNKCRNFNALRFRDFQDKQDFITAVRAGGYDKEKITAILHEGACSDTMEYNGKYMMDNNYAYSKTLLAFCLTRKVPFLYASSASVYGNGRQGFREEPACENALNVYACSKMLFDRHVRRVMPSAASQVVGLRYFNVFGPQENHKGTMASVAYHFFHQLRQDGVVRLFAGTDGYADGEQRRDFIYVKDVVNVNLFFLEHPEKSGIFNCGTGHANTFNAVARAVIAYAGRGRIEYIPFPEKLIGKYQSFTQADTAKLLAAGYDKGFTDLPDAVAEYCRCLQDHEGYLA